MISKLELENITEDLSKDERVRVAAQFLLDALNDWPTLNLSESVDLVAELKMHTKDKLNHNTLTKLSNSLTLSPWKMEAISTLLQLFNCERNGIVDKEVDLETLIQRLF